ncbi:vitamin K epoxide reductase family protein [Cellulomonas algicola]|uniref:Membrane protein n=1 Tax=Cellulomonas algicola TaxID=2071633 RepID=A0A401V4P9_9CELL|nr:MULTISPECIES: vitamin K epoxide reductase family protein [Cellulomonas]GCD21888.1 membrane protein [Cellulomonas algicola]
MNDATSAAAHDAAVDEHDEDWDDDELVDDDPDLLKPAPVAWRRRTAIEMAISGAIGLYTSFVLSIEAIVLAREPDAVFGCSINSVINCVRVAESWQASLFGFPNAFLGIAAEAVVLTMAVAMIGGVLFPRWFMLAAEVVYTAGLVFAWWLFYEAYTDIKALCPWCLLITVTTTLVWAGLTRINIRDGHLNLPGRFGPGARRFVAAGNDWFVTIAVLVVLAALVFFGYGWSLL